MDQAVGIRKRRAAATWEHALWRSAGDLHAAWKENNSRFKPLAIAMFTGLDAPTGVAAQGICAAYFFSMDALN